MFICCCYITYVHCQLSDLPVVFRQAVIFHGNTFSLIRNPSLRFVCSDSLYLYFARRYLNFGGIRLDSFLLHTGTFFSASRFPLQPCITPLLSPPVPLSGALEGRAAKIGWRSRQYAVTEVGIPAVHQTMAAVLMTCRYTKERANKGRAGAGGISI